MVTEMLAAPGQGSSRGDLRSITYCKERGYRPVPPEGRIHRDAQEALSGRCDMVADTRYRGGRQWQNDVLAPESTGRRRVQNALPKNGR